MALYCRPSGCLLLHHQRFIQWSRPPLFSHSIPGWSNLIPPPVSRARVSSRIDLQTHHITLYLLPKNLVFSKVPTITVKSVCRPCLFRVPGLKHFWLTYSRKSDQHCPVCYIDLRSSLRLKSLLDQEHIHQRSSHAFWTWRYCVSPQCLPHCYLYHLYLHSSLCQRCHDQDSPMGWSICLLSICTVVDSSIMKCS